MGVTSATGLLGRNSTLGSGFLPTLQFALDYPRDLRAYQRYLADHLRPASVPRKFHALRGFLRWCVGEGEIPAVLGRIPDRGPLAVTEEAVERTLQAAR